MHGTVTVDEPGIVYYSYMLRLWQVARNSRHAWRASLESAQTREQFYFVEIDDLVKFLLTLTVVNDADHDVDIEQEKDDVEGNDECDAEESMGCD
jgi:hypothetical protein